MSVSDTLRKSHMLLQERSQKELDVVRGELEKLRSSNRELFAQLFDANQRGHLLATSLGFNDIYHAANVIGSSESSPIELTYRSSIERAKSWEGELRAAIEENRRLIEEMRVIEEDRDALKGQLASAERKMATYVTT
jgi:hypothetical protein